MNHSYISCTPSSPFAMNIPQIRIQVRARPRKLEWKQTYTNTMPSLKFREIRISQVHNVHRHTHTHIDHSQILCRKPRNIHRCNCTQFASMGHHECSKNRWQEAKFKTHEPANISCRAFFILKIASIRYSSISSDFSHKV